jgi:hypothetical protein
VDNLPLLIAAGVFEAHLFITDEAEEEVALGQQFAVWSLQGEHPK